MSSRGNYFSHNYDIEIIVISADAEGRVKAELEVANAFRVSREDRKDGRTKYETALR